MNCINCNYTQDTAFYQETYPCTHCGSELLIEYNMCPKCGIIWRSINGVASKDSVVNADELMNFFPFDMASVSMDEFTEEGKQMWKNIEKELQKADKITKGEASMSDHVHKCLKCQEPAHEERPGFFKCGECGFSWEVINFE